MRSSFLILVCLFSLNAGAAVHALFPSGNATLIIQGSDSDANALFDSMNVVPVDDGKRLSKHVSYQTMFASSVFDLTCNKSRLAGIASCTLKFFSPEAFINESQKIVLMGINDKSDARSVAKMFIDKISNPYQAEVFLSTDLKLRIWKTFDSSGDVVSVTMSYN